MSLGKLLKAGKGLMGGPYGTRYQMHKHVRLPKFGSARNPFAPETRGDKPSASTDATPPEITSPGDSPAVPLSPSLKSAAPLAVVGKAVRRLGAKWGSVNPFTRLTKRTGPARSATFRPGIAPPVQAELSLEKVQVVRNDLTDADVEIVPAVPPAATEESPPLLAAMGKNEPAGNTWSRLSTRFFGAGTPT